MKKIKSILYVEDDIPTQELLAEYLESFCDDLFVADNGIKALELYKIHKPQLVISDIKMPWMDGLSLANEIKQIQKRQHIIFMTAFSDMEFLQEAINVQVDGYILKPVDLSLVDSCIEKVATIIALEEKVNEQEVILDEIANMQENMVAVISGKPKVLFINNRFLDFLNIQSVDQFSLKHHCFCELFIANDKFYHTNQKYHQQWMKEIEQLEDNKRVVLMMDFHTMIPKSFLVSVKYIQDTQHTVVSFTEVTNLTIEKNSFEYKAMRDSLTSIYNRAFFNEELQKTIEKYKREKHQFSLVMFDIDHFKSINDTYGHHIGDVVLQSLTLVVQSHIRVSDTFARWGGEEFILIADNSGLEDSVALAQNLRKAIEETNFKEVGKITCSFGVVEFSQDENIDSILEKVDHYLYEAKEGGRNCVKYPL